MRVEVPGLEAASFARRAANVARTGAGHDCGGLCLARETGEPAAGLDVGEHQRGDVVAVGPANTTSRT